MKNLITSLLLISVCFSCDSTEQKEVNSDSSISIESSSNNIMNENYYSNDSFQISFHYPKYWKVRTDSVNRILYILSPLDSNDTFQEMMNIVVGGTKGLELDEFLSVNLTVVEELFEELSVSEAPGDVIINDKLFKKVKYNYVSEGGGYPLTASLFVTHANNNAYIINCSALQNTFDQFQNEFMSVVNSIKIKRVIKSQ